MNKRCRRRQPTRARTIASVVAALFEASYASSLLANPTGAQVVAGSVSVNSPTAGQMNITQGTPNAIVNWNTFSIGAQESVTIAQPSASAALLNRVVGNDPSSIAGRLQANGRVFLVNPAGVIFAPGSSVNVGSLVASTLNIADSDFLAGRYHFVGASAAQVSNAGTLTAQQGGTVALLGGTVSNAGTVTAKLGTVALGAGSDITLDFAGDGLTTLTISAGAARALIGNTGTLAADGGLVVMSAQTADALAATVVNQQGIVRAQSLAERNGRIVLDGGSNGETLVSGTLDATGGAGLAGGRIDVTGYDVGLLAGANVNASGAAGGGSVHFGGGAAGQDPSIRNANALWMAPSAQIHADALANGNGGNVVAFSEAVSRLYGTLSAKGGPQGGDGGSIETSGRDLDMTGVTIDASAPKGKAGTWLIDPENIEICQATSDSCNPLSTSVGLTALALASTTPPVMFGPYTATLTQVSDQMINTPLNSGTSVVVQTTGGGISMDGTAAISKTSGADAKLTMEASGSITLNSGASITSSGQGGTLDVILNANVGGTAPANVVTLTGATIDTNGGAFTIGDTGASQVNIATSTISTEAGSMNITGSASGADAVTLTSSLLSTTNGSVTLSGTAAVQGNGVNLQQSAIQTANGTVAIAGTGASGEGLQSGVLISGGEYSLVSSTGTTLVPNLDATGSGTFTLSGTETGAGGYGVQLSGAFVSLAGGAFSVSGSASTTTQFSEGFGIGILTSQINSTSGAVTLTGSASTPTTGPTGMFGEGVVISGSAIGTTSGNLQVTAAANEPTSGSSGLGADIENTSLTTTTGALNVLGSASATGSATGVFMFNGSLGTTTGATNVLGSAAGAANSAFGVQMEAGTTSFTIPVLGDPVPGITTTSGNIDVAGSTPATTNGSIALDVAGVTISSTSGTIQLSGTTTGTPTVGLSSTGVVLERFADSSTLTPAAVTTGSGALSIDGSGFGSAAQGVLVADGSSVTSNNGGAIDMRGVVTSPTTTTSGGNVQFDYGTLILDGSVTSTKAGSAIALAGSTNTSDAGLAFGAVPLPPSTITGSVSTSTFAHTAGPVTVTGASGGTIVLRAANDNTSQSLVSRSATISDGGGVLAIAPATVDPATFALTAQNTTPITLFGTSGGMSIDAQTFATFTQVQSLMLGSTTQTGRIAVDGQCVSGSPPCQLTKPSLALDLTLANPGAGSAGIRLPLGLALGGHTLTLDSAGSVTDPGGIVAAQLLLAGPGSFALSDPQNNVGVLAMANAGTVDFLNSVGFVIGPVTGRELNAATGARVTLGGGDSTLTGNLVAEAATGNIALGSATAGGPNTNLSAGGTIDLVMENGVFVSPNAGTVSAANGWRIWASTWTGETRGNVQPNTSQPNFYGCTFGTGCSWGGTVPLTGDHYVYVARPTVTLTANNAARLVGTPNPAFSFTVSGLINGDTAAGTLTGSVTSPATQGSPAGQYPINPAFLSSVGYIVDDVPGTLTVTAAVVPPPPPPPPPVVRSTVPTFAEDMPLDVSALQSFFGAEQKTFVYENNLQGTNICIGSNQPLLGTPPGDNQDLLAVEWKRVRSQPNLNSCLLLNGQHGCGDF